MLKQYIDRNSNFCTIADQNNASANFIQSCSNHMTEAHTFALEQAIGNISLELGRPSEGLAKLIEDAITNNWSSKELIQSIQDANRA